MQQKTLGVNHPDVVTTYRNLADCAVEAVKKEEAAGYYRCNLEIQEKMLGPPGRGGHPARLRVLRWRDG